MASVVDMKRKDGNTVETLGLSVNLLVWMGGLSRCDCTLSTVLCGC